MDPLKVKLERLRIRLAMFKWIQAACLAILLVMTACCAWLVFTRLFPQLGDPVKMSSTLIVIAVFGATAYVWRFTPDLEVAAILADRRLGSKERLISSLAFEGDGRPMVDALHRDARKVIEGADLNKLFPLPVTKPMRWVIAPILVFGLLYGFMPQFDLTGWKAEQARIEAETKKKAAVVKELKTVARAIKPESQTENKDAAKLATEIEKVAEDLESGKITDKQAMARISDLASELEKMQKELAKKAVQPAMKDLSKFGEGKDMAKAMQQKKFGEAAKKMAELQKKIASGEMTKEQKESLQKDLESMAKSMSQSDNPMAKEMAKQLQQASKALLDGNAQQAMEKMKQAGMSMKDMQSAMEQLEKLDQAQKKMCQCKNGMNCKKCNGPCNCPGGDKQSPGQGQGMGMKNKGQGFGGEVGPLPDPRVGFSPSVAAGPTTKGKALASIMEKGAPETDASPTIEHAVQVYSDVRQENESALTKEEIPPGAKEFVRQYFGAIDPNESEGP